MGYYPFGRGANRKGALGTCDRCDFTYRHRDLKEEYFRGKPLGNRVCPTCYDEDHPQNFVPEVAERLDDPRVIQDARPDTGLVESRKLFSWDPVGLTGLDMEIVSNGVVVE